MCLLRTNYVLLTHYSRTTYSTHIKVVNAAADAKTLKAGTYTGTVEL